MLNRQIIKEDSKNKPIITYEITNICKFFDYLENYKHPLRSNLQRITGLSSFLEGKKAYINRECDIKYIEDLSKKLLVRDLEATSRVGVRGLIGRPCMAAFAAGSVTPMRRKKKIRNVRAPLNIVVSGTVNIGMSLENINKVMSVISSVILAVKTRRPVDLTFVSITDPDNFGCCVMIKISKQNLDIKRLLYMLSSPSFIRQVLIFGAAYLSYDYAKEIGLNKISKPSLPYYFKPNDMTNYKAWLSKLMPNTELFFTPIMSTYSSDFNKLILNPEQWAQQTVHNLTN